MIIYRSVDMVKGTITRNSETLREPTLAGSGYHPTAWRDKGHVSRAHESWRGCLAAAAIWGGGGHSQTMTEARSRGRNTLIFLPSFLWSPATASCLNPSRCQWPGTGRCSLESPASWGTWQYRGDRSGETNGIACRSSKQPKRFC